MSQSYICQEYRGVETDEEEEPQITMQERHQAFLEALDSDDEFAPPPSPRPRKKKRGSESPLESYPVSKFATFSDQDLSYFVTRVSMENQERMKNFLREENGQMSGIIYKMLENRLNAMHAKINKGLKELKVEIAALDERISDLNKDVDKVNGMSKFTYAWCKSAQEAGVFKMKQRY